MNQQWVTDHLHLLIVSGSRLYGTARPDSDYDYRGVCAMPATALIGLQGFEQYQGQIAGVDSQDVEVYGISKFFSLALANNPNILDILFAPPSAWLRFSPTWEKVYAVRHWFLSERVRHTFSGYAVAQLKRLQGHRKWLTGEVPTEPRIPDFGGMLVTGHKGEQRIHFSDPASRGRYESAKLLWDNYNRWQRERNPRRMETEIRVGYDTKNAAHLVRLLIKCVEILETGNYNPKLHGDDLIAVRKVLNGALSYDELIAYSETMQAKIADMPTVLRYSPDRESAETLLMRLNFQDLNNHAAV